MASSTEAGVIQELELRFKIRYNLTPRLHDLLYKKATAHFVGKNNPVQLPNDDREAITVSYDKRELILTVPVTGPADEDYRVELGRHLDNIIAGISFIYPA